MLSGYLLARYIFSRRKRKQGKLSIVSKKLMPADFLEIIERRSAETAKLKTFPFERISMQADDGAELVAYLFRNGDSKKTAILVHGYGSSGFVGWGKEGQDYIRRGYNLLLPDERCCGESGGDWITFGILESLDLLKWTKLLVQKYPEDSIAVQGCSMGAATCCMFSGLDIPANVKAIVSDCGYADIREQIVYSAKSTARMLPMFVIRDAEKHFRKWTCLSYDDRTPEKAVRKARVPIFFVHGTEDRFVPPENAKRLYDACSAEKELLYIEHAPHAMAYDMGKEKYTGPVFEFIEKRI